MAEEGEEVKRVSTIEMVIKAVDELTEPIENAEHSLRGLIGDMRQGIASFAELYAGYETFEKVLEPASAMQEAQVELAQATNASNEQLEAAWHLADQLSTVYGASAEDITAAQAEIARHTGSMTKALAESDLVVKYAAANHMKAAEAARVLTSAVNVVSDHTKSYNDRLQYTADLLTVLQTRYMGYHTSAERISYDLANITSAAHQHNVAMNDALGLYGLLSRVGLAGERGAGRYVAEIINEMFKSSRNVASAWSAAGLLTVKPVHGAIDLVQTLERAQKLQPHQLAAFLSHLGISGRYVQEILDNLTQMPGIINDVTHTQNKLNEAWDKAKGTEHLAFRNMMNAVEDLLAAIGTPLLGPLTSVLNALTRIVTAVKEFGEAHPAILKTAAVIIVAAAGLVTLVGALGAAVGVLAILSTSFAVLGVALGDVVLATLVGGAIFASFAALIALHWTEIVTVTRAAIEDFRYLMDWFHRLVVDPWGTLKATLHDARAWWQGFWDGLLWSAQHPIAALGALWKGFDEGLADIESVLKGLYNFVIPSVLRDGIQQFIVDPLNDIIDLENKLKPIDWKKVLDVTGLQSLLDRLEANVTNYLPKIIAAWNTFKNDIMDIFNEIGTAVDDLIHRFIPIRDLLDMFNNFTLPSWLGGGESTGVHNPPGVVPPALPSWAAPPVPALPPAVHPAGRNPYSGLYHPTGYSQSITYAPNHSFTINAGAGTQPEEIQDAVQGALDSERDRFERYVRDLANESRRTTFEDIVYNT